MSGNHFQVSFQLVIAEYAAHMSAGICIRPPVLS
jgi:hypothetical protein